MLRQNLPPEDVVALFGNVPIESGHLIASKLLRSSETRSTQTPSHLCHKTGYTTATSSIQRLQQPRNTKKKEEARRLDCATGQKEKRPLGSSWRGRRRWTLYTETMMIEDDLAEAKENTKVGEAKKKDAIPNTLNKKLVWMAHADAPVAVDEANQEWAPKPKTGTEPVPAPRAEVEDFGTEILNVAYQLENVTCLSIRSFLDRSRLSVFEQFW
ncbi:hypothetical protein CAEBREN_32348 [Caenorhabditis brenneri]|uniref:Uncharacterized protein n=1 Tax=Caenorhabditis brenneri TaxID=135651 RepID=G0NUL4_CAEBE|nr:hypothetical protein CAEBREN_32348 [Caenorhabditis brenneri]